MHQTSNSIPISYNLPKQQNQPVIMDEQDKQKYQAIEKLIKSGVFELYALKQHGVSLEQWRQWQEASKPPDIESAEYQYALDTINTTAQTVRNLMITFVFVLTFIAVMALSADDRMLFLNEKIMVPLLNIGLPADKFFFIAPLLLLILHGNFTFNLYVLMHKIRSFEYIDSNLYFPFLLLQSNKRSNLVGPVKTVGLFLMSVISIAPFYFLIWITYRLAIIQEEWLTNSHKVFVTAEFALLIFIMVLVSKSDYEKEKRKNSTKIKRKLFIGNLSGFLAFLSFLIPALLVPIADSCSTQELSKIGKICKDKSSNIVFLPGTDVKRHFEFPAYSDFTLSKPQPTWQYNQPVQFDNQEPSRKFLKQYISQFSKGHNFSDRNLRYLKCRWCSLQNSDFTSADLSGADLSISGLTRSDLTNTNFYGSKLVSTEFGEARLIQTNFNSANLQYATFRNSDIRGATFNKTSLEGTQFIADKNHMFAIEIYHSSSVLNPNRYYNYFKNTEKGRDSKKILGTQFLGSFHSSTFCNFKGLRSTIKGFYKDTYPSHISNLSIYFSDLSQGYIGEIKIKDSHWHFVDLRYTEIDRLILEQNQFDELNVTNTKFSKVNISNHDLFKNAMCLTPDRQGKATPPFSHEPQLAKVLARDKWPICRPWPIRPIPCGSDKEMKSLIEKQLQLPREYCYVGKDGLCRKQQ